MIMIMIYRLVNLVLAIYSIRCFYKIYKLINGKSILWLMALSGYSAFILGALCLSKTLILFGLPISLALMPIYIFLLIGAKGLYENVKELYTKKKRK